MRQSYKPNFTAARVAQPFNNHAPLHYRFQPPRVLHWHGGAVRARFGPLVLSVSRAGEGSSHSLVTLSPPSFQYNSLRRRTSGNPTEHHPAPPRSARTPDHDCPPSSSLHPVHANHRLHLPISYLSPPISAYPDYPDPHTLSRSSSSRRSSGAASPSSSQRPPSRTGTRQRTSRAASR